MISNKLLVERANELIAGGNLTELQITQLSAIPNFLNDSKSIAETIGDLPSAADNQGRMVYVVDQEDFFFSDGEEWLNDFDSSFALETEALAWGNNTNGRLGDDTTTERSSPVTVVGSITNWASVSAGAIHSLGVTDSGIAYAWGNNGNGRLGDDTITDRSSPVTVIGGITDWVGVSAGNSHSLGVTDSGIAYAWGNNPDGRLGDGTTTQRTSPVTVIGGITDWASVSGGGRHSLGLYVQ